MVGAAHAEEEAQHGVPTLFPGTGTHVFDCRGHLPVREFNGIAKEMDRDLLPGRGEEGARRSV